MAQNMNSTNYISSSPPSGGTPTDRGALSYTEATSPPSYTEPTSDQGSDHAPNSAGFTVDGKYVRAFIVVGLRPTPDLYEVVANSYQNFRSLTNIDASLLMSQGSFSVEFADIRDAAYALSLTCQNLFYGQDFQCVKLFKKDLAMVHGINPDTVSNHTAEYLLSVIDVGAAVSPFSTASVINVCQTRVAQFSDVRFVLLVNPLPGAIATFRVEWYDSRAPATLLSGVEFHGYRLTITPNTPDMVRSGAVLPGRLPEQARDRSNHIHSVNAFLTPRPARSPAAGPHNVVDISKITTGQDVRTTIMLRNIPNRVDQASLKRLIDETSLGQYDFMYLRIDFANNCNVGYAFINFVDPMAIIPFARRRAGQKWNLFSSEKIAEISYATIQGRDCLIQKFRNSSVMLEQPAFRPKLYKTGNGADAGTEEAFPTSDNHAKLKRSCDNAEHVGLYHPTTSTALVSLRGAEQVVAPPRNQAVGGVYTVPAPNRSASIFNVVRPRLYAPREGQAYRERQRRQGSQFDRGTPGAEFERRYVESDGQIRSGRFSNGSVGSTDNLSFNFHGLNLN